MKNLFNVRSFIKFLGNHKLYTFIEIFGLSVSFMFVILISVYTWQELSTDRFQENADRLYVLANENDFGFAYKLGDRIKERYPEIEAVCPMINYLKKIPVKASDNRTNADLLMADSAFFNMFTCTIYEGNRLHPMEARDQAVISRSFANKAFPGRNPLGEVIEIEGTLKVVVNGVMEDIRNSVIPYGDIILRIENSETLVPWDAADDMHSVGGVPLFFLTRQGTDIQSRTDDLLEYLKEHLWVYRNEMNQEVSFMPIKEAYFSGQNGYEGWLIEQGNRTFVMILLSVGLLILIFAIINYVNLSVAQTGFRAKEMATRRLLGSSREELFGHLIFEATLLSCLSFVIGLLLAFAAVPFVNNLLQTTINLNTIISPATLLLAGIVVVLMGFISGLLPAIIISNAKPVEVVKGSFRQQTKMVFSKVFITFQNVITIALVAASVTMVFQIHHLIKAPLGYKTANIIDIPVESLNSKEESILVAKELEQLGAVSRIGYSRSLPFHGGNNYTMTVEDNVVQMQVFEGDSTFMNILGFEIIKDNHLASGSGYYLTPQTLKELNLDEDAPSFLFQTFLSGPQPIAGIIKEFQLQNILHEPRPVLLGIKTIDELELNHLAVEITGHPDEAFEQIKEVYERITRLEFPGKFINQQIEQSFSQQRKTSQIVVLFAGVAVLLSLLGLLAMSTYFIQQRSREIAVRKVFGSNNPEILKQLISTFLSYVVIAFFLVTPFIWYLLHKWLAGYTYHISLSPWIFIASGIFCLFIAFCTVFWQSYIAANSNPVDSIKAE